MTAKIEPHDDRPEPNADESRRVLEALKALVGRTASKPVTVKVERTDTGGVSAGEGAAG